MCTSRNVLLMFEALELIKTCKVFLYFLAVAGRERSCMGGDFSLTLAIIAGLSRLRRLYVLISWIITEFVLQYARIIEATFLIGSMGW